jgi:branched-chain amino acid transport system ATP-binding protein
MVELASAVASGADLLFFDEASAGLGPDEAQALGDRFHALRDELGLTLVVIEHHVPLIARTCDYVYCLASGRLLAEGEPAAVQRDPEVIAEFLGRSSIAAPATVVAGEG